MKISLRNFFGLILLLAPIAAFSDSISVTYYGWSNCGDVGANAEVYCEITVTNSGMLIMTASEGGFKEETYSMRWGNVQGDITGDRVKTATAFVTPSNNPIVLYVKDGGTTWPNQASGFGADVCVYGYLDRMPCGIVQLYSTKSPLPLGDVCQLSALVQSTGTSCDVEWSLQGDTLDCTIDADTGELRSRCKEGTLTVRATLTSDSSVYKEAALEVKGDCPASTCGSIGQGSFALNSVDARFNLGSGLDGDSAGSVLLQSDRWSSFLTTPFALSYEVTRSDVEVLRDDYETLRQIKTPQGLVDIQITSTNQYTLNFYTNVFSTTDTSGYYVVTGALPEIAYQVSSGTSDPANPGIDQQLIITETRNSDTNITKYLWDDSEETWTLSRGGGESFESLALVSTNGYLVETRTLMDSSSNIAYVAEETYITNYPGDQKLLIKQVLDPNGVALTSSNSYDATSGRLTGTWNADGSYSIMTYNSNGLPTSTRSVWADSSEKITTNIYATSGLWLHKPRTVEESVDGVLVSKTTYDYETNSLGDRIEIVEQYSSQTASSGDAGNLITTNVYFDLNDTNSAAADKIKSITHPDGKTENYIYEYGSYTITDAASGNYNFVSGTGQATRATLTHGVVSSSEGVADKTLQEITIQDPTGHDVIQETRVYDGASYELARWKVNEYDVFGHLTATYNSDGTSLSNYWSTCCGQEWTMDETGQRTDYTYDSLRQLQSQTAAGIEMSFEYDGNGNKLSETVSGGSLSLVTTFAYDLAGRMTSQVDSASLTTTWSYAQGGLVMTKILPGGSTEIAENYTDGRIKSITGTAVVPRYYSYDIDTDGTSWALVNIGSSNSPMWELTTYDFLGHVQSIETPTVGIISNVYNTRGQLVKVVDPNRADTVYEYDELGNQTASGFDVDENGSLDRAALDQITEMEITYEQDGSDWWKVTATKIYPYDNSSTVLTNNIRREKISGSLDNVIEEIEDIDIFGQSTLSQTVIDRSETNKTQTIIYSDSVQTAQTVNVSGLLQSTTTKTGLTTTYEYDELGRLVRVIDPQGGTNATTYNDLGQISSIQNALDFQTSFGYDSAGRKAAETNALGYAVRYGYDDLGNVTNVSGDATYPVDYEYDVYGRQTAMTTHRISGDAGDTTQWLYDESTGWLTNKQDAAGQSISYSYADDGKIQTRTWARGITTTYSYDNLGNITNMTYSDGTPSVSFVYDRLGRIKTVADVLGTRTFGYNSYLQQTNEIINGQNLVRSYDSLGRDAGISLGTNYFARYSYDTYGRFSSLSSSVSSVASYSYFPNTDLIGTMTAGSFNVAKTYDVLNRLSQLSNLNSHVFSYGYNSLNQRTNVSWADGSYWRYGYDEKGQVTSANKYWNDGTSVTGQQFSFSFDEIGNRDGSFSANALNQYTQRIVAGSFDFIGTAASQATVTVNNRATTRQQGGYFHVALPVTNTTDAAYEEATIIGVMNNVGTNGEDAVIAVTGHIFVAETPELFTYDADGNLLSDGRWNYSWDAENRLVSMETRSDINTDVPQTQLDFAYDYLGRRISKVVNGATNTFIYDGWNLIAEVSDNETNYYFYGLDFSGSLQGAGGIGGLVSMWNAEAGLLKYQYDGNGNVVGLIDTNGTSVAVYEYDSFGKLLRVTGDQANDNPFRFSTKYFDEESGLIYYGHRFANPQTGRFLNRDPLGDLAFFKTMSKGKTPLEQAALAEMTQKALYLFVHNNPIDKIDYLGLASQGGCCGPEVSGAIQRTLAEIESRYRGWSRRQKAVACVRMITLPWAIDAWDIGNLADLGFQPTLFAFDAPARQGTGSCKQTVAYGGRCYKSNAANFMMWGKINSLCHDTFDPVFDPIVTHMPVNRWGITAATVTTWLWKGRYGWADVGQAISFTRAGFRGGGPANQGCTTCIVEPSNVAGNSKFKWRWEPYKK